MAQQQEEQCPRPAATPQLPVAAGVAVAREARVIRATCSATPGFSVIADLAVMAGGPSL